MLRFGDHGPGACLGPTATFRAAVGPVVPLAHYARNWALLFLAFLRCLQSLVALAAVLRFGSHGPGTGFLPDPAFLTAWTPVSPITHRARRWARFDFAHKLLVKFFTRAAV